MSEIKDEMAGCGIHLDCTDDMSEIKGGEVLLLLFLVFLPVVAWPHCFAPMLGQQGCTGRRRREPQGPCIPLKGTSGLTSQDPVPTHLWFHDLMGLDNQALNTWFLGGCSRSILYHMARDEMRQDGTAVHGLGWHGMRPKTHGSGAVVLF